MAVCVHIMNSNNSRDGENSVAEEPSDLHHRQRRTVQTRNSMCAATNAMEIYIWMVHKSYKAKEGSVGFVKHRRITARLLEEISQVRSQPLQQRRRLSESRRC